MPLSLRPATEEDSPHIGRIGAASFADSVSRVFFPENRRHLSPAGDAFLDEAEWRASRNTRRMKEGKPTFVVVDRTQDGKEEVVVGFAQWDPPKRQPEQPAAATTMKSEADGTQDPLPACLDQSALKAAFEAIETETQKVLGPEGYSKMWYLMILGVDPKHHRRGIGKMLVNKGLELAKQDGKDVYLIATPNGQKLYESVGFKAIGEGCYLGDVAHYSMLWRNE